MEWTEILEQLFTIVLIPLLGALTVFICNLLNAKNKQIQAEVDNELCKKYADMLTATVKECVVATNQTYVESLKQKGEFGIEAQKEAFHKTYEAVLAILSDEAKEYLTHAFGDLSIYITNKIEEEVVENKKRDA